MSKRGKRPSRDPIEKLTPMRVGGVTRWVGPRPEDERDLAKHRRTPKRKEG